MKTNAKRLLALLLCGLMLTAFTTACSDGGNAAETDAATTTTTAEVTTAPEEEDYLETLGTRDFEGSVFAMAGISDTVYRNFADEEMNGEAVNDALVARDRSLSENYNVKIETKAYAPGSDGSLTNDMRNLVLAGDNPYSLVIGSIGATFKTLATAAALTDIRSMPYIDVDNPWWSSYASQNLTIDGKLYFTTGDVCPNFFYVPYVMCYNVDMADDSGIDMYSMVMDGEWTIDRMREFTSQFTVDLDGDGEITPEDQLAYTHVRTAIVAWAHYIGAGLKLNTVAADGSIVVDLANDKSVEVIDKLQTAFTELKNNYFDMDTSTPMFIKGNAFMFGNSMATVVQNFRDMDDDYNFLPTPKYDEAQDVY